jgi:hypothetical protein
MTASPKRIQRQRTTGWRMPEGAVYVGRGSAWGNPFAVWQDRGLPGAPWYVTHLACHTPVADKAAGVRLAVALFRDWIAETRRQSWHDAQRPDPVDILKALRGRDLACWCAPGAPCHADVLLEIANAPLRCEAA